jgi:hypothetical protein
MRIKSPVYLKQKFTEDYSVITFATNKPKYLAFAFTMARSVLLFNDIAIYIVSNLVSPIPEDLSENVFIVPVKSGHAEKLIGIKIHLNEYIKTEHSLFIDSDCICYGNLSNIFSRCCDKSVSVAGRVVKSIEWCSEENARTIKENFGIDQLIRFNGGLYYLRKSELTNRIFEKVRAIADNYDQLGFSRIGESINEEGPISVAMMLYEQRPIPDNGSFMTDLFTDRMPDLNVLTGRRFLKNPPTGMPRHRSWYPSIYSPVIIHFGGGTLTTYPYNSQRLLLILHSAGCPSFLAAALVSIFINVPYYTYRWLTGTFSW